MQAGKNPARRSAIFPDVVSGFDSNGNPSAGTHESATFPMPSVKVAGSNNAFHHLQTPHRGLPPPLVGSWMTRDLTSFFVRKLRMDSKQCSKCKQIKFLSEFNTRSDRPSGYRSDCRKCQYARQISKRPPWRSRVYNKAHYAKKVGLLIPPSSCERCPSDGHPLQMHHPDYSKPLTIVWVCQQCHTIENQKKKAV